MRRREEPEWWAEARRMRAAGEKIVVIEVVLGKSRMAVSRALDPEARERTREATRRWMRANRDRVNEYRRSWLNRRMKETLEALPTTIRLRADGSRAFGDGGISRRTLRALERRGLATSEVVREDGRLPIEVWRRKPREGR